VPNHRRRRPYPCPVEGHATVRLTEHAQAAGCASKLAAKDLEHVLEALTTSGGVTSDVIGHDDAGWIEFGEGFLLQSVDFFAPVVDDPYRFGQIAAANALSDIYAMGGDPVTALNLVAFPRELGLDVLNDILAGGMDKIAEAGAVLCGGHSVRDLEPKYGVSVTGYVERDRLVRNQGARPGDALVLTKPLGVGILTTAIKRGLVSEPEVEDTLDAAARLNRHARDAMLETGAHAATDVTGYGLLGHLHEMLMQDGLGAVIHRRSVPVWSRAADLAAEGCYPGGLDGNRAFVEDQVSSDDPPEAELLPLYDPQTSGGLLIAIDPARAAALTQRLAELGDEAAVIGEVSAEPGIVVAA
jgi:selenide,water dikinase